jgi:hypothetical protein
MDFLEMDFDPGESDEDFAMPERQITQGESQLEIVLQQPPQEQQQEIVDKNTTEAAATCLITCVEPQSEMVQPERPSYLVELDDTFDGVSSAPLQSPAEHSNNLVYHNFFQFC